jgi:hypothetical protein
MPRSFLHQGKKRLSRPRCKAEAAEGNKTDVYAPIVSAWRPA